MDTNLLATPSKLRLVPPLPDAEPGAPRVARRGSRRVRATSTSNFGVSRRESHDASDFYARFAPPVIDLGAEPAGPSAAPVLDDVVCGDSRSMDSVADNSVALVVTSPPYFAGKEYEEALGEGHVPASYLEYLQMLTDVFAECVRALEPGGRIAVNVANLGRRPYRSLSGDVTTILQDRLGLLLRGEVIWLKQRGAGGNCAWGSFQRPGNPVLRDTTERVVIASKGRFDRSLAPAERARRGLPSAATIGRDEFIDATLDVWELPAESATRVGHPAPFPVALPERMIQLHTYAGDLVLDPFMGSGSTAVAALRSGRHFVGYDTDETYVAAARERIAEERERLSAAAAVAEVVLPAEVAAGLAAGHSSRDVAAALLASSGVPGLRTDVRCGAGIDVPFAFDGVGDRVLVDLCGSSSTSKGGLGRGDVLWRALGRVAVLRSLDPEALIVLLTPELPAPGTAPAKALEAVLADGTVAAVLALDDPAAPEVLRSLGEPIP